MHSRAYSFGVANCVCNMPVDEVQCFMSVQNVTECFVVVGQLLIELVRYNHVNFGMCCDRLPDIIKAHCGFQLKKIVDMPMRIMNDNVPPGIICVMCQLRRQTRRQMTVVELSSIVQLEQLSHYAVYQPHESVGIAGKVIYRLDKAGPILRKLTVKSVNHVRRNSPLRDFPS